HLVGLKQCYERLHTSERGGQWWQEEASAYATYDSKWGGRLRGTRWSVVASGSVWSCASSTGRPSTRCSTRPGRRWLAGVGPRLRRPSPPSRNWSGARLRYARQAPHRAPETRKSPRPSDLLERGLFRAQGSR